MFVILWPNDDDGGVNACGPFPDEDAANSALDKFVEVHEGDVDVEDYDIVELAPKLTIPT